MARFNSISCGKTLLKSKQPTYQSLKQKKAKSLELRSRPKVPPDATRQKLARSLGPKDVFRFSDADQI